jgi:hypothetical protein
VILSLLFFFFPLLENGGYISELRIHGFDEKTVVFWLILSLLRFCLLENGGYM